MLSLKCWLWHFDRVKEAVILLYGYGWWRWYTVIAGLLLFRDNIVPYFKSDAPPFLSGKLFLLSEELFEGLIEIEAPVAEFRIHEFERVTAGSIDILHLGFGDRFRLFPQAS